MYKGYIYRHWIINDKGIEKSYIGQVYNRTPEQRWGTNGRGYLQKRKDEQYSYFGNAIKKYGWDNFQHKVLLVIECETLEELVFWLDQWETFYIEKYDSFYNGYNGTNGGKNGYIVTDETKYRQSESHKKYYDTEQGLKQCQQHSERMSGELNPFYGKTHDDEARQKISDSRKNYVGEKHPMYGKDGGFKGKTHTEETKQKMSKNMKGKNSNSKVIICLETKDIFVSIRQAEETYHLSHGGISACLKGKKLAFGSHDNVEGKLHWMYYKDYLEQKEVTL